MGSDSTKTMVVNSYTADVTPAYTVNGINYYRALLLTDDSVGEVKAFLWKADDTYEPLATAKSVGVN